MVSFILNDETIQTEMPSGMTVLDFVRYHQHQKGTKIGCREGDCGACTLLVGEIKNEELHYQTMTSCLMPLSNARGKHIVTIEGINPRDGSLTPVQQAMVEENGTQCGFCTVGFVMSLTCYCLERKEDSLTEAISSIDGNICRCTGYKSIERATSKIADMLRSQDGLEPISYNIEKGIIPSSFAGIKSRLKEMKPDTLLTRQKNIRSGVIVSGGTDIYVQHGDDMPRQEAESVFDIPEMKMVVEEDGRIIIGGSATVSDLLDSAVMQKYFPQLYKHLKLVSSTPIRNMATVAGNIVNASPIGDLTIWFMALDATVVVQNKSTREIPLRDFYQGYKELDKAPDEIVSSIYFRKPDHLVFFNFEKVSKRTYLDIATVNTAIFLRVEDKVILECHISAGGVAPIPLYLKNLSSCFTGKKIPFDGDTLCELDYILQSEISPISDVRGSADYKRLLLRQLIHAHFIELFGEI